MQVLINVLDNAIKFTIAGEITVHVKLASISPAVEEVDEAQRAVVAQETREPHAVITSKECTVSIEVTDTGVGVSVNQTVYAC